MIFHGSGGGIQRPVLPAGTVRTEKNLKYAGREKQIPVYLREDSIAVVVSPYLPVSFPAAGEAVLFSVAWYGWVASEIVGSLIIPRLRRHRNGVNLTRMDRGSGLVVIAGVLASIFVAFVFSVNSIAPLPAWTFFPGIALMAAGILLRQWSVALLGKYFSMLVSVQQGQSVIREGPYRYIRHPAYAGTLLIMLGIGLAIRSFWACIVLLLVFAAVHGYRIRIEEQALTHQLGEAYTAYREETAMLIPFIL